MTCRLRKWPFRELLRGRSLYGSGAASDSLAPFQQGRLSLPESVAGAPYIGDVCGKRGHFFLEREGERMLKPVGEAQSDLARDGTRCYCDPILVNRKTVYVTFLKDLMARGLLDFTLAPLEDVGIFCVWKKGRERLRLILDARRSNQWFRRPPSVDLISAEGLSSIELDVDPGEELDDETVAELGKALSVTAGVADVKDAFHRLRMRTFLRRYFCFPPARSGSLGLTGRTVEGHMLTGNEQVWPCPVAFPMGFSWSLFFCQVSGEELSSTVPGLGKGSLLQDRGRPLILSCERHGPLRHYMCVDNMGVMGTDRPKVEAALGGLTDTFTKKGLVVHEQSITSGVAEVLGVELDGSLMQSRATGKRRLRARQAISGLLRRGRCSGSALEVLLGHLTFLAMSRRPVLSCFHACYSFVQNNYLVSAPLWNNVIEELRVFAGLMVFLCSDWRRPCSLSSPRMLRSTDTERPKRGGH